MYRVRVVQEINNDFSEWLVAQMRQRRIDSQAELARLVGVTDSTVSRWIIRGATPDRDQVRAIAAALQRPVIEVLVAAGFLTLAEAKVREIIVTPAPSVTRGLDDAADGLPAEDVAAVMAQVRALRRARGIVEP